MLRKAYQERTGILRECFVSAPTDGALALAATGRCAINPMAEKESSSPVQSFEAGVGAGIAQSDAEAVARADGEADCSGCAGL